MHPQFSLLQEPSTAVVQVCCGSVIWGRRVGHVLVYLLLHSPTPLNRDPTSLYQRAPSRLPEVPNSSRTAIIFVCVDSFVQVLTPKHRMLTMLPVTPSHAHDIHITGLVTASAAIFLAGSSSRSCSYVTLAV